jgi:hypothetical protein
MEVNCPYCGEIFIPIGTELVSNIDIKLLGRFS